MSSDKISLERFCLVTVGATVGFKELTDSVLHEVLWEFLVSNGFTSLRVQCGPDIQWAADKVDSLQSKKPPGLAVSVFDVKNNLLKEEMIFCKAADGHRAQGLVICHAGTGTILDAWRLGIPMIVVPNTSLLDDHQTEMAKHLAKEGYATMSSSNREDLQEAIRKAELLQQENQTRWPSNKVTPSSDSALRLWQMTPTEVRKEQNVQMAND